MPDSDDVSMQSAAPEVAGTTAANTAAAAAATTEVTHAAAVAANGEKDTSHKVQRAKRKSNEHAAAAAAAAANDKTDKSPMDKRAKRELSVHAAEAQDATFIKPGQKRHKANAKAQLEENEEHEEHEKHEEEEAEEEEEDEDEGEDEEEGEQMSGDSVNDHAESGLQLGNVDLATADRALLSDAMLAGLRTAIQDRLKQYASSHVWSSPHVATEGQDSRYCAVCDTLQSQAHQDDVVG